MYSKQKSNLKKRRLFHGTVQLTRNMKLKVAAFFALSAFLAFDEFPYLRILRNKRFRDVRQFLHNIHGRFLPGVILITKI